MTNMTLFTSVSICSICHLLTLPFIIKNMEVIIISLLYFYGLFTSFLNHGTTNQLFKKIDRISMRILFIINILLLFIIYNKNYIYADQVGVNLIFPLYMILILSGLFYYCSKLCDTKIIRNIFHIFSHIFITFINIIILYLWTI